MCTENNSSKLKYFVLKLKYLLRNLNYNDKITFKTWFCVILKQILMAKVSLEWVMLYILYEIIATSATIDTAAAVADDDVI